MSSFVDNHEDLGELLVDKNGEILREFIRNKLSETPHILDQAIFSVIEHMAAYTSNEASGIPSFSKGRFKKKKIIMEFSIKIGWVV